jgi:hypothetical protein
LDDFLHRVAGSLFIPKEKQNEDIQDWKRSLGKYYTSVALLRDLAKGPQWITHPLDSMVKTKIGEFLHNQSGIPILSILYLDIYLYISVLTLQVG